MYQYIFALVLDNVDCYSSLDVAAPHQLGALCQILINGGCQFPTWQTWIRNKKKRKGKNCITICNTQWLSQVIHSFNYIWETNEEFSLKKEVSISMENQLPVIN